MERMAELRAHQPRAERRHDEHAAEKCHHEHVRHVPRPAPGTTSGTLVAHRRGGGSVAGRADE